MPDSLLILGASVRAAAQSAARAGLTPICGDLFGDADLPDRSVGQVARSFPSDLVRIAAEAPTTPWMYTGGLENYPRVVAAISRGRELYGNSAEVLRRVRNPFELERVVPAAGLLFAECVNDPPPYDGRWLRKHRRSSAGLRVEPWLRGPPGGGERLLSLPLPLGRGEGLLSLPLPSGEGWGEGRGVAFGSTFQATSPTTRDHYFQRWIEGTPLGAVYVAATGSARLLGVSKQLIAGNAQAPFRYGGSIAPTKLADDELLYLERVGNVLAESFQLRGLFGVDLISAADGLWAIEVNPRYTASVEVLERVYSMNAIAIHLAACRDGHLPVATATVPRRCWGKAVVYANCSRQVTAEMLARLRELNSSAQWPAVADLPRVGTLIERDHPAVTVFADGADQATVATELARRTAEVRDYVRI